MIRRGMPRRRRRAPRLSFLGIGAGAGGASARTLERAMGAVWVLPRKCSPLWGPWSPLVKRDESPPNPNWAPGARVSVRVSAAVRGTAGTTPVVVSSHA